MPRVSRVWVALAPPIALALVAAVAGVSAPAIAMAAPPPGRVYNKIGFHLGPGGNQDHITDFMTKLDAAKIPFFMKSVDAYGTIGQGAALAAKSGVPHTLVWRNTNLDAPDYTKDPASAASEHWNKTMAQMPAGFDKTRVWLEIINEPDQTKCDWLGQFGVAAAGLSMAQGYRLAMFSFATGNPPVEAANPGDGCWHTGGMQSYLKLAGSHSDKLAVALHEYSLTPTSILKEYPYLVGRYQFLFAACDKYSIPRPTVMFTEWGWGAVNVPGPQTALQHIDQAMITAGYANHTQILGGAIWYLGPGFGGVANQADQIVEPLLQHALTTTYPAGPGNVRV